MDVAPTTSIETRRAIKRPASRLAVTYTASGNCSLSGNQLTLLVLGTCTITAHQAGDANYFAAPDVMQAFRITRKL